ncbi:hypothetical protein BHM03_00054028 [Ensete ventricosum]|nr:hypothetical protein BHM03_00054028 [Ensete ventricosum]
MVATACTHTAPHMIYRIAVIVLRPVSVTATIIAPISCDTRRNSARLGAGTEDGKYEAAAAIHMFAVYSLIFRDSEREREQTKMAASPSSSWPPPCGLKRGVGLEVVLGDGGETPWSLAPSFKCGSPTPAKDSFVRSSTESNIVVKKLLNVVDDMVNMTRFWDPLLTHPHPHTLAY